MDNNNNYNSYNSSNNNSTNNNNENKNNNNNNNNSNENNSSDDFIENVNSRSMNSILNCPSSPSVIMERRSSLPNEFQSIKEMAKPNRKTKKPLTTTTTTTATPTQHPKRDHSAPISVHSSKAKLHNSSSDFNFVNGNNPNNNNNNNNHVNHNNSKNNKNHFKNELSVYNQQQQQQQQQLAQQYGQQLTNNGYILIDENKEEFSPGDFNEENLNEHSELIFDFKEVADHFMRKSEQEIEKLKGENFELKNVINAMKQQLHQIQIMQNSTNITNDLNSMMSNNDNDNKQILFNKQIINLQEELIRVKLQLEQSQRLRANELKKRNNENSASSNSANSSYNNGPTKKNLIEQNANLLSELSKLRASEAVLRDTLETERTKVSNLNERNFELTQKLYEYELNDNGVNAALTSNPPKVIIGGTKNETLYQEILNKLKAQGFDDTSNYQDVIICLYQQRSSALKQLNELLFYMKQLNINCNDPVQGMQKLFEEFKSYKNEIEYLNNKINTMKLEIEYHQIEYTNQIKQLLEERDNLLNNINDSDIAVNGNSNNNSNNNNNNNNSIVNHKSQNIGFNGNDNQNPNTYKITYNFLNNRRENSDSLIGNYDNNSTENFYLNDETQLEDQQQFETSYNNENSNNDQQRGHYRSSFQVITTKTYQLPDNINEPIENLDDDDDEEEDEYIEENQRYEKETVKNQNYNKPQLSDREWKKEKLELVNSNEQLTFKIGALEDQLQKSNENLKTMTTQHEQNVQYLNEQISHYKVENEKQKQELNEQRTKYKMKTSDLKRKIEQYERDIAETSKQFNKYQIEIEKLKLDLNFKIEENKKLQKEIDEYAEYKAKCYQLEEKLNSEIRNNQNLQNKIMQLEQNLFNVQVTATKKEDTNMSSEKIIDNLKEIIKEQINSNRGHSAIDIEEYKLKVHELHMKLSHEKLLKESLEIKLKLVEQDNQNLRQTLLSNTKKFANNNEKVSKNRIEEINELIEKAQLNAQNLIASNPNMVANLLETK